ncbi:MULTISPECIES: MFS transporter [Streptomyces]|uniref:MFS transporter n=1 Tax=Streptomyces caniscabiei TaxID=2746961 RepID=A0ABU4MF46_9ACTN|nr:MULTISPECIES: MFS transporter [Streptomyces]MDX2940344.1 MFS transporter [Streptomyces caniscabiei]MDX2950085.1 MFS transporter [Streptomyces caniscabiei]MDX2985267.1 MFS transporter [Streptomyces caniscabiei]MDX3007312.1 MFS transporter [Streptomyces caniscabiei]MDX3035873.1 MFS transporter [Streptomyces caniscabiei]
MTATSLTAGNSSAGPARGRLVLLVVVCAQMLIWLDTSILNVAVTTLADPVEGLGATPGELEWVASAYTLVVAGTLFAGGALADRFGPRNTLVAGLALIGVASGAGAFVDSPEWLIVARVFMGAGAGLLMPATLTVIVQSTPEEKRTRAIAIWSSSSGLGVAIGPVAGGALLSHFWWGSVFLVNVPIVALCLPAVLAFVPDLGGSRRRVLDLPGLLLSVLGLGGVVYGIIELGGGSAWYGPHVLLPLVLGGVVLVVFVAGQRRSSAPSLDLRLFRQPGFTAGSVVLLIAFMALAGHLFYAAFYLQGPRGLSPADAGTVMIAAAIGIVLGSQASPALSRRLSARWTVAAGVLATAATYVAYAWLDGGTPLWVVAALLWIQGFGMGLVGTPVTAVMMRGVPPQLAGAGSAVNSVTRQVGGTLGVAMAGSILSAVYRDRMADAELPGPAQGLSPSAGEQARTSAEAARALADSLNLPGLATAADRAFLDAMYAATLSVAALALIGCAVAVTGLRDRSAPEDREPAGSRDRTRPEAPSTRPQDRTPPQEPAQPSDPAPRGNAR